MSAGEIHVGDVGTALEATIKDENGEIVNVASATSLILKIKKPNGTLLEKDATLTTDGTDGKIEYITESGDLSIKGEYIIQGFVEINGGSWHSDKQKIMVWPNL